MKPSKALFKKRTWKSSLKTMKTLPFRFKKVHGSKYNYSKYEFTDFHTYSTIICPIHGEFQQPPMTHLKSGCNKCGEDKWAKQQLFKAKKDFKLKVKKIHEDTYSYEKFNYKSAKTKGIVVCKLHGDFSITPNNLLTGHGCQLCGHIKSTKASKKTFIDFLKQAINVHGDKFTYDKLSFTDYQTKCKIFCKAHGVFYQKPSVHCQGKGCIKCANANAGGWYYNEPTRIYYVYFPTLNLYKIGITITRNNIKKRFNKFPKWELIETHVYNTGKEAFKVEKELHRKYKKYNYKGKAVLPNGNTELFTTDLKKLKDIVWTNLQIIN